GRKLDPGASLNATSIGAKSLRTATVCCTVGPPASRGVDSVARRNIIKYSNGTTIRSTDPCQGHHGEANAMKRGTEVARQEQVSLSGCSLPSTQDAGINKQDSSPKVKKRVRDYPTSSASGTTVFVRSEKWGMRRQEWAQEPRRAAEDGGSLGINSTAVAVCKHHSTAVAYAAPAFKREPIRRAWDRRSTAGSVRGNIT
ncbi:unnamed protein product, partial [Ectocarpus sp. 12 AP-2014]